MLEKKQIENVKYLLSYPDGFDKAKKYPLIVFLHGAGTRADDTHLLEANKVFLNLTKRQTERGYVVLAPLCHTSNWIELMPTVMGLVNEIRNAEFIDTKRVYLTGNSMGGYGTWALGGLRPDWFACIMPVCGGAMVWHEGRTLTDVPVRTFHGLRDKVVDPIESLQAAKEINSKGGYCELILYPECEHNCWDKVYTNEANYDWMLKFTTDRDKSVIENLSGDYYG